MGWWQRQVWSLTLSQKARASRVVAQLLQQSSTHLANRPMHESSKKQKCHPFVHHAQLVIAALLQ